MRGIGLQENLSDVAVPELPQAAGRLCARVVRGEYGQRAKETTEMQKEKLRSPQHANFGLAQRVGVLALPVGVERDRSCRFPGGGRRESIGIKRRAEMRSEERRVGKECRSRWATYHEKKKKMKNRQSDRESR